MARHHALGVHVGHDRGAALVSDGELIAQVAEERLDRKKHSDSLELPLKSIYAVLEIGRVRPEDLGIAGISYLTSEIDKIASILRDELRDVLGAPELGVVGVDHHDCHAWSAYCTADIDRALIVIGDGAGDIIGDRAEGESVYIGHGEKIELVGRRLQDFGLTRMAKRNSFQLPYMNQVDRKKDISLGHKYEQFTYLSGFEHREGGKTMGLAAYGKPLFAPVIPAIRDLQFPLTFETGLVEVDACWRASGEPWHRFLKNHAADIAASGQALLEGYVIALLNAFNSSGSYETLCAAGGVFLNCQMNGRIIPQTRFRKVHVIPAAGDDGVCIGAAYYAYARAFETPKRGSAALPFLGKCYDDSAIRQTLESFGMQAERYADADLAERLASDLTHGKVIGLLRGRSEVGPRALCHRSILADPRDGCAKDYLNRLKGREMFRPFAPVVTEEDQSKYFELEELSPYMLFATRLRPEFHPALPAIVHVDGSSRVQAISKRKDCFVHALLRAFESRTGFPVLLNTSFNLAGDPIVDSPHDAILSFLKSRLDVLVMENYYADKKVPLKPFSFM